MTNQLRRHVIEYDPVLQDGAGDVHTWRMTAELEYEGTRDDLERIVRSLIRASEPAFCGTEGIH